MSTRSNVIIKKSGKNVQLYHHHDGYPSGVGVGLSEYFEEINNDEALSKKLLKSPTALGKWLSHEDRDDEYRYEGISIGLHGDIEYLYVIDLDTQEVSCYACRGWDLGYDAIVNETMGRLVYTLPISASVDDTVEKANEWDNIDDGEY